MLTKFDDELNMIWNPLCKEFAKYCVNHIHERFFEEAASTTGKYHPAYAIGKAGLYRHTCAAVAIANSLMELDCVKNNITIFGMNESFAHDVVILALIMHDSCKCGRDWDSRYTRHDHPILAKEFVNDLYLQALSEGQIEAAEFMKSYVYAVGKCIESHMGQWNRCNWSLEILPLPIENIQIFVHLCDYLASRKFLNPVQ